MKSAWKLCVILFLATALVGQTSTSAQTKKAKAAPLTAADVQSLKDAIASQQAALAQQQQQIQELREELRRRDQTVQQAQSAASDAAGKADAAQAEATQQQQTVTAMKSDVADLKAGMANTVLTLQETQKNLSDSPMAIHVKGITITPGGFLAAEFVRRNRALGSDVNTPFNSVTMPGASTSSISEFFGSGRQSRVSLLAEGRLSMAKLSGYVESDFLSAGVTSNNNQSNSYTMRQRQAWGQAAFDNGWTFTGGQMWSLVTETKHGVDNRTEALPMTIDANYSVGFSWARQYGLRLSKNINNKAWLAVAVEDSQATVTTFNNGNNYLLGTTGVLGGLYNNQANYSFNPSPDVVAKLAVEPGFGHFEVFGVYSRFRDRAFPCGDNAAAVTCPGAAAAGVSALGAFNSSRNGGGVGANIRVSLINKHLDIGAHAFGGSGIGRYGSGGLPDATIRTDGTLRLLKEYQGLGTIEWHGPKIDIYLNAGGEYVARGWEINSNPNSTAFNLPIGYGSPSFNNAGCFSEALPGAGGFVPSNPAKCRADTRFLAEGTIGFWYKLYDGSKEKVNRGRVQFGPQFSYVDRQAWSGAGGEPHGLDGMIFTSFRYYLP